MTRELTPADREQLQLVFLRRWLALRFPKGTKRRTDHQVTVKRFDMSGRRKA
jgi:hypothetical protein